MRRTRGNESPSARGLEESCLLTRRLWKRCKRGGKTEPERELRPITVPDLDGKRVIPANVRQMLKRYAERVGLPLEKAHPHALRHTFATEFLREGGELRVLSRILRHSSLQSTSVYVHAEESEIEEAMKGRAYTTIGSAG